MGKVRQYYVVSWTLALVATLLGMTLLCSAIENIEPPQVPADPNRGYSERKVNVNIATGGIAGVYYPIGTAIADILNKNSSVINANAQSSGASVANINLLRDGKVELALVQNDTAYYANSGIEMFSGNSQRVRRVDGLQGVATLYEETVQIITLEEKNIKSVNDLKGKRVAVGALGSGTEANARQILEIYDINRQEFKPQYLSFGEAIVGLLDGTIDAAFVTAGAPTSVVRDIAFRRKIILVPISKDKSEILIRKYPFFCQTTIKANTYPSVVQDIPAVAVKAMLVTTESLSEELVYDILKAIFTNPERLRQAHSQGAHIRKETALDGMSIPLHLGAKKFFNK